MRIHVLFYCLFCCSSLLLGQRPYVNPLTLFQAYESTIPTADLPRIAPQRATHYNASYTPQGTRIDGAQVTLQRFRDDHYRPVVDSHRLYLYDDSLRYRHPFLPTGYYRLSIQHPEYVPQQRWVQLKRLKTKDGYRTYASFWYDFYGVLAPVYAPFMYKEEERVLHEGMGFVFPLYLYPNYMVNLTRSSLRTLKRPQRRYQTAWEKALQLQKDSLLREVDAFRKMARIQRVDLNKCWSETLLPILAMPTKQQHRILNQIEQHPTLEADAALIAYTLNERGSKVEDSCQWEMESFIFIRRHLEVYPFEFAYTQIPHQQHLEKLFKTLGLEVTSALMASSPDRKTLLLPTAHYRVRYTGNLHPQGLARILRKLYDSGYVRAISIDYDHYH